MTELKALLPQVLAIAEQAGQLIQQIYQTQDYQATIKADQTPVTTADIAAHDFIVKALAELDCNYPILSEEDADIDLATRQQWQRYWLVDPLDGTQEFVARSDDFACVIALIENGKPVLGVIDAPISGICYSAYRDGGAYKHYQGQSQQINSTQYPMTPAKLRFATSRVQDPSKLRALLSDDYEYQFIPSGSASLKCCLVAEGKADAYVRLGPTGEWDTGAAQVILDEAGGKLLDLNLQGLTYNQRESLENPNFIALGSVLLPWSDILR